MRSGRLLVEESPENLLNSYRLPSLEDVFLKICIRDGVKNRVEKQRIGVVAGITSPAVSCQTAARAQQPPAVPGEPSPSSQYPDYQVHTVQKVIQISEI